jgi:hypothetical protein
MRKVLFALLVAATSAVPAGIANAQSSDPGEPATKPQEVTGPRIDVTADAPQKVCRAQVRTGTRMGTSRVCRTQEEWDAAARRKNLTQEEELTAAAQTLNVLSEASTTGDLGGMSASHDGPLGPR